MILGMSIETFTLIHVVISLIGIGAGYVYLLGVLKGTHLNRWNTVFLVTTIATSVTGFLFPFVTLLPSHVFGAISLLVLAVAILALRTFDAPGAWRKTYIVCAAIALYLNSFVGMVQAFQKIPLLRSLAPTQSELPFAAAQLLLLVLMASLTTIACLRFRDRRSTPVLAHGAGGLR
jgi:hypothetical protein